MRSCTAAWIALAWLASGCDSGMDPTMMDGAMADAGPLRDAGMPPDDDAGSQDDDAGPVGCTIDCDCPQGQVCFDGTCVTTGEPLYCCEHGGCPQGAECVDTGGVPGVCPECVTHCDCPQGELCTASGLCVLGVEPVYCCDNADCPQGEACTDASGAAGTCRDCNSHCDCEQGQICTASGLCLTTSSPVYCCDNPGCPSGQMCESRAGVDATCATSPTCGNLMLDSGETCDGDCPASCDDLNPCTRNVMSGSAATCDVACTYPPITMCGMADGCCPGCAGGSDPDCSTTCGNGMIDPGETCDGASCPTSCNDGNACTRDMLIGSAAMCTAQCTTAPISSCMPGDGCCPSGCVNATDSDCPSSSVIGNACTTASMCGAGGACVTNFQGGYCTRSCMSNAECGGGAHCNVENLCVRNCTSPSQCRTPEYGCFDQDNDTVSECWPLGTGTGAVGDVCTDVGDCAGNTRGLCLANNLYQGYCSLTCSAIAACPSGSHCIFDSGGTGICAKNCTDDSMCRPIGYECYEAEGTAGDSECWASATGTGDVGDPCMDIWECAGGTTGFCATELTDGSSLPGGYCSRTCQPIVGLCPTGSHCNGSLFGGGDAYCVADCATTPECRPGYSCYDAFMDPFGTADTECWVP